MCTKSSQFMILQNTIPRLLHLTITSSCKQPQTVFIKHILKTIWWVICTPMFRPIRVPERMNRGSPTIVCLSLNGRHGMVSFPNWTVDIYDITWHMEFGKFSGHYFCTQCHYQLCTSLIMVEYLHENNTGEVFQSEKIQSLNPKNHDLGWTNINLIDHRILTWAFTHY